MFGSRLGALALASCAFGSMAIATPPVAIAPADETTVTPARRKRALRGLPPRHNRRRSRRPQAHPKRKRNMVTHSRRVRRKRRRAA